MDKLSSLDEFRAAAREGAALPVSVQRLATGQPVEVDGQARTLRFCFSDASVDRAGDSIKVDGWDVEAFGKNPVALWAHDSWAPPVGRASNVGPQGKRLMGDIEFADAETYEFADTVFRLYKGGFLNAVSVGFNPLEWTFVNDKDRPYGIDFVRQELLEISPCPVPCNSNALMEARAKGIDIRPLRAWAEKVLDGEGTLIVPRTVMEDIFKAANTPHAARAKYRALIETKSADWKCDAAPDLAVDEGEWDGAAAEAGIFERAGGEDFDPAEARKGFLAYDAAAPKLRGSYKLPFARIVDGELKASAAGIRAAAARLPDTEISDTAKTQAQAVIAAYEEKMAKSKDVDLTGAPAGNCGRTADMDCGMTDPAECSVHASKIVLDAEGKMKAEIKAEAKALVATMKAGRMLSQTNEKDLRAAVDHHEMAMESHQKAADMIKGVLARHDAAATEDDDPDQDDPASDPAAESVRARANATLLLAQRAVETL